ncbi:MAG: DUF4260 domain-containing protein [Nitrospinae bacterium]|nr:DUF4260 domain-containing protein [Nitrospinota bacterium]
MVTGFQRIESLFIFVLACAVYFHYGFSWILFFFLILAPDIFFAGYLINPKIGARVYNIGHIYAAPVILLSLHYSAGMPQALPISIIWIAHIAFDRVLGFGLKYESGFKDTHLGKINR